MRFLVFLKVATALLFAVFVVAVLVGLYTALDSAGALYGA